MPVPVILLASAAAPVVDIDGTIFIQAGIFLVLMAILHPLLFQPWLAARARREHAIDGTLLAASALRLEAERAGVQYDAQLATVRAEAAEVRSDAVKAAESDRQGKLAAIRATASAEMQGLRDRLAQETATARGTLAARVDELAQDIATRILGRTP